MKKIMILLSITLLLACAKESMFDLLNIKFGQDSALALVKGEKSAIYPNYISTYSNKMMVFDGMDLTGYNSKKGMKNSLVLYYKKEDKKIFYYSVSLLDGLIYKKLLHTLTQKFGEADYREYRPNEAGLVDFKNDKSYSYIWEDKPGKRLFVFLIYSIDNVHLNVMKNPSSSKEITGMAHAYYWGDFVDARNRKKDENYTYRQYLVDEKAKISPAQCTVYTLGKKQL